MNRTERLNRTIDAALERKAIVGTVLLVAEEGEITFSRAAGFADREAGRAMEKDAIFRLASLTKPIVASAALAMIDKDLLSLEDEVSTYVPQFTPRIADGTPARVTIRHLLTHTAGLTYDYPREVATTGLADTEMSLEDTVAGYATVALAFEPGTEWRYSVAIDVLGAVVAAKEGTSLAEVVARYVTGPLGMVETRFDVTDRDRLATPYGDGKPEPVRMGEVHTVADPDGGSFTFSPGRIFNPKSFQSGGAGMAGTASDFMKLLEALRLGGGPLMSSEIVAQATQNQIGDLPRDPKDAGQRFGFIGAIIADPVAASSPHAAGTFAWGGVYGHTWFVDPVNKLSVVSLSNTAVEGCKGAYRNQIRDAVYG